jgi:hypothetical protein
LKCPWPGKQVYVTPEEAWRRWVGEGGAAGHEANSVTSVEEPVGVSPEALNPGNGKPEAGSRSGSGTNRDAGMDSSLSAAGERGAALAGHTRLGDWLGGAVRYWDSQEPSIAGVLAGARQPASHSVGFAWGFCLGMGEERCGAMPVCWVRLGFAGEG